MSITMYKTKTCGVCTQVKKWLGSRNIEPKEVYIDDDPKLQQYVIDTSGYLLVPFIVVEKNDETFHVSGGNIPRLAEILLTRSV